MTLGARSRRVRSMAAAKKVRGEGHWQPAIRTKRGLEVLDGERFLTPTEARNRAKILIAKHNLDFEDDTDD